jgi:hypothetical protein
MSAMDLDLFDTDSHRGRRRHRRHDSDDGYRRDDRDHGARHRRHDSDDGYRRGWSRRAHPHVFAWVLLGGGVLVLGLIAIAAMSALGLWPHLTGAYFTATTALMPESWHDEWHALPGVAHVAIVLGGLFLAAGVAGEVFD